MLGDLETARRAFAFGQAIVRRINNWGDISQTFQNFAFVELMTGCFPAARATAQEGLTAAGTAEADYLRSCSHSYLATALSALGNVHGAREQFAAASSVVKQPLYSLYGVLETEFRLACGDFEGSRKQCRTNRDTCKRNQWFRDVALCDTLLGLLLLPDDPSSAGEYLDAARSFGARSGDVEIQLRSYQLATELARTGGDFRTAAIEAESGILLADSCGFGWKGIELRLPLARVHLDAGDAQAALRCAREALGHSTAKQCQYAWGEADALDLAGRAHARLGETALARQRLTVAVAVRERLSHPGLADTRAALGRL